MSDREDIHELVTELREKDGGEDWRACDWLDVVRVYDYQQARIDALVAAARPYMRERKHSDGCARLMRSNGSNQCVCGHNALAALLENE